MTTGGPGPTIGRKPMGEPPPFRLSDDLPAGVTLLEASAGTGKTHTIAALAVRYLAEGVPVDRLLVVTFTRSATGELRTRVRQRLVSAESGLRAAMAAAAQSGDSQAGSPPVQGPAAGDELVALLATGDPAQVAGRQRALADALADFDAATITTIHGFCEQVLGGLGTAADSGRDLRFVDDLAYLADEVVDDLYLRKSLFSTPPTFSRSVARDIVGAAVAHRDALIEPSGAADGTTPALRSSLAARGRQEVLRRARHAGLVGYDDQLDRLRSTLQGPAAAVAVRRLQNKFSVVLVDEFQDTDPVQWDIFRIAFAGSDVPLLLIGDPKQAIYSFRGADVWAYLAAAAAADRSFTLRTNWRSDQPLLDAVDGLLAGATLGHRDIVYRTVTAAPGHQDSGLRGAPVSTSLRLRLLHRSDGLVEITKYNWAQVSSARAVIAADAAADIVALLSSGATLRRDSGEWTPVVPGDLAVLVRANHEAAIIHEALSERRVPAVIAGGGSVFATPAAGSWLTLLEALEQPAATMRVRAAALTPFVGWDPARLVDATSGDIDDLQATLHRWAGVLGTNGVAALTGTMIAEVGLVARELAGAGGERRLTDLGHVAELLHAEALTTGSGARALTAWLKDRIDEADRDTALEERSRRLESDAAAVQIQTIHRSKGLEYPIVYLPFSWWAYADKEPLPVYHDEEQGGQRTIDVGGEHADGYERHRVLAGDERRGEDLRQAYVALTRARHQLVVWWATGVETKSSPLARLLLGRHGNNGSISTRPAQVPKSDDDVEAGMQDLAARVPGRISVERIGPARGAPWQAAAADHQDLGVSTFERDLDTVWRRSSYTAITAAAHGVAGEPVVASEAEHPGMTDESAAEGAAHPDGVATGGSILRADLGAMPSPMADLPAGAGFGIAVHAVCEEADFAAPDLDAALTARIAEVASRYGAEAGNPDPAALAEALTAVIETPLGPLAGGRRLRDLGRGDRLDELGFELPLIGGDTPAGLLAVADIAACLRHWLPAGDPLAGYPERLEDPVVAQALRGYLTGSIDLVLRVPADDGPGRPRRPPAGPGRPERPPAGPGRPERPPTGPRHVVVDYKTNWLGPPGEALTAGHYQPARLSQAMVAEHYPLQAILYQVALHRYLRWRMVDYDPERHLGGILYLFVRGMCGPDTPVVDGAPCGVFAWDPPAGMTVALSNLLDAGTPPAEAVA